MHVKEYEWDTCPFPSASLPAILRFRFPLNSRRCEAMGTLFRKSEQIFTLQNPIHAAIFVWIAALSLGSVCAACFQDMPKQLFFSNIVSGSFPGMLLTFAIPFLVCIPALHTRFRWLLFPLIFYKGFTFSFFAAPVVAISSGWFVLWFLFFGNLCSFPLFWLLWLCLFRRTAYQRVIFPSFVFSIMFLIASFDYTVIFPFGLRTIFYEG